jgi:glycosyltransferase involved in cell wall biosynthesis
MSLVSIILPNYNHKVYLQQRIQSILSQTYQNFELIILDDASTDGSKEILEIYRNHPKVSHMVFNTRNSGSAFKQWKKGIGLAKGEWIWIAESDDDCELTLLEVLVSQIETCHNTILSYCQSYEVDESGNIVRDLTSHTNPLSIDHWKTDYCCSGIEEIKSYLLYRNTIPNASAVLFKKSAYEKSKKVFEDLRLCGDWMLWIQILLQGIIAFHAEPLNYFRSHNNTTRIMDSYSKKRLKAVEEFRIVDSIKIYVPEIQPKLIKERFTEICRSYIMYSSNIEIIKQILSLRSQAIPRLLLVKNYLLIKHQTFFKSLSRK